MGVRTRELFILLVGDILLFFVALWLTLLVRYLKIPNEEVYQLHAEPFIILSFIWFVVFSAAGLYDKHTTFLKGRLLGLIINTQVFNTIIAALFFFVFTDYGIQPKTTLVIYLVISSALLVGWRLYLFELFAPRRRARALLIVDGPEAEELVSEINSNARYHFEFVRMVDVALAKDDRDFEHKLLEIVRREDITVLVANLRSDVVEKLLPAMFDMSFLKSQFIFVDFYKLYEDIFDRVPLSSLRHEWFFENVSQSSRLFYDVGKRAIDIVGSIVLGAAFILILPLIYVAIKIEDKGPVFITQDRMGRFNHIIKVYKLRTMTTNDAASSTWVNEGERRGNRITKVGAVLRKLSLDEVPQVFNILKGEMSLIGPRNDIVGLGTRLAEEIPYYDIRNFVKPGVTGWAQTHQHYMGDNISPQSIEESRIRLAYDLYYVKNVSLLLDIAIALRTVKTILSRFGFSIRVR